MEGFEPKKLALLRIWEILHKHSDIDHPLTQENIAAHLSRDYGIELERKAVSRNLSLLKEAGLEIEAGTGGCWLSQRIFEDSELHLLIDGVLCSRHITASHSKDLIERLCGLSNEHFKSGTRNIYSVNDWSKTDNQALFYNIELIDSAIEQGKQIHYNYNKFGEDKKLHKTSQQYVSPYQLILHNQRYYLMAYSDYWGNMVFHRLDHITDMTVTDKPATPMRNVEGFENGVNYKQLISATPYMFTDRPECIVFNADAGIIDQIIDWLGKDVQITGLPDDSGKVRVAVRTSPKAMEHWAMQYAEYVEIISPAPLRERIREILRQTLEKYAE